MQTDALQKKYSIGEASEFLGVSIDTLRRWEKTGKVIALRSPGGHRYFLKEDLEKAFGQKYSRNIPSVTPEEIKPEIVQAAFEPTQVAPIQSPPPPISPFQPTQLESKVSQEVINQEKLAIPLEQTSKETTPTEILETKEAQEDIKRFTLEEFSTSSPNQVSQIPQINSPQSAEFETTEITNPSTNDSLTDSQPQSGSLPSTNQPVEPSRESLLPEVQQSKVIATVNPQEQKGGSLKKVAIFLLIVFLMINIILIGFYIFVSKQL